MRNLFIFISVGLLLPGYVAGQNVGIGTASPNASAQLDIAATDKGLLIPRMMAYDRAAIAAPATGLQVYQLDGVAGLYYFDGKVWRNGSNNLIPDVMGNLDSGQATVATSTGYSPGNSPHTPINFIRPCGVAKDPAGNFLITDTGANLIMIFSGNKNTGYYGSPSISGGNVNGPVATAKFKKPIAVACDPFGGIYIADSGNGAIRKIRNGVVSTIVTNVSPGALAVDADTNIYFINNTNELWKATPSGSSYTAALIAGAAAPGTADGPGTNARFANPKGIAVAPSGIIYVVDYLSSRIRTVTYNAQFQWYEAATLAGSTAGYVDSNGTNAKFRNPYGITLDDLGNLYISDSYYGLIRTVSPSGAVQTYGGTLTPNSGASPLLRNANFSQPFGIARNSAGTIVMTRPGADYVYVVSPPARVTSGALQYTGPASFMDSVGIGTSTPSSLLSVNGTADKAGGGSWGTFSDARVKQDVADYTAGLEQIMAIHPVSFRYNSLSGYSDTTRRFVGVIAQEIEQVLPSTVTITNSDPRVKDKRQYDGSELTYTLINAVKEQQAAIAALKNANARLAAQVKELQQLAGIRTKAGGAKMARR